MPMVFHPDPGFQEALDLLDSWEEEQPFGVFGSFGAKKWRVDPGQVEPEKRVTARMRVRTKN
jgi:hypothetical protein